MDVLAHAAVPVMTAVFLGNFAAATLMLHTVSTKMRRMTPLLYRWLFLTISLEGVAALLSFMSITHAQEVVAGLPLPAWIAFSYALVNANLFTWVYVFHLSSTKWEKNE